MAMNCDQQIQIQTLQVQITSTLPKMESPLPVKPYEKDHVSHEDQMLPGIL